jgi:anti-sigma regulatory factor (Ser/Thr protein kinase)
MHQLSAPAIHREPAYSELIHRRVWVNSVTNSMLRRLELIRDERAPAAARRAVDDLRPVLTEEARDDARLLLSELVANSVQHGAGETITVLMDPQPDVLRCEVIDDGDGFVPPSPQGRAWGGWGLNLVSRLSRRWGISKGSTHVWFELPIRH